MVVPVHKLIVLREEASGRKAGGTGTFGYLSFFIWQPGICELPSLLL